jgi:predicted small metal-binding protein
MAKEIVCIEAGFDCPFMLRTESDNELSPSLKTCKEDASKG